MVKRFKSSVENFLSLVKIFWYDEKWGWGEFYWNRLPCWNLVFDLEGSRQSDIHTSKKFSPESDLPTLFFSRINTPRVVRPSEKLDRGAYEQCAPHLFKQYLVKLFTNAPRSIDEALSFPILTCKLACNRWPARQLERRAVFKKYARLQKKYFASHKAHLCSPLPESATERFTSMRTC